MSDIQAIEQHIVKLQDELVFAKQVAKLSENRDFRKVILEGFCKSYVADLMELAGDSRNPERGRQDALSAAYAAGHLKRWLLYNEEQVDALQIQIEGFKEELDELRVGGDE